MRNVIIIACSGFLCISILGCASSQNLNMDNESITGSNIEPPFEFEQYQNPFYDNPSAVSEGKEIYIERCESCHGVDGDGEGPMSKSLDPKPGSLIEGEMSDQYLHWRITEGGMMDPFNSVMPAWKTILSDDQIGKVIVFIRSME